MYIFFFFFQAEDGIRDGHVTGVQTCALPICYSQMDKSGDHTLDGSCSRYGLTDLIHKSISVMPVAPESKISVGSTMETVTRSEERRVGKEWRRGWSRSH